MESGNSGSDNREKGGILEDRRKNVVFWVGGGEKMVSGNGGVRKKVVYGFGWCLEIWKEKCGFWGWYKAVRKKRVSGRLTGSKMVLSGMCGGKNILHGGGLMKKVLSNFVLSLGLWRREDVI